MNLQDASQKFCSVVVVIWSFLILFLRGAITRKFGGMLIVWTGERCGGFDIVKQKSTRTCGLYCLVRWISRLAHSWSRAVLAHTDTYRDSSF